MIKLWIAQKIRFLSCLGWFLAGFMSLIAPWYVFLLVLAVALVLDYIAFSSVSRFFDEG